MPLLQRRGIRLSVDRERQLAVPAVAVLLLVDFGLAVVNRVSPQVQVYFLGMTAKGSIGLLVLLAGLGLTVDLVIGQMGSTLAAIQRWIDAVAHGVGPQ